MPIEPWLLWLIISILMLVVEFITVGFFFITIAAGALLAMLLSLFSPIIWIQVAVFLIASVVFFFTLKPFMQRLFPVDNETHTAVNRVVGKTGIVVMEINNLNGSGQVKIEGDIWSAKSIDGTVITEGAVVLIKYVEGVKVIVEYKPN